jgi:hypothetical protein
VITTEQLALQKKSTSTCLVTFSFEGAVTWSRPVSAWALPAAPHAPARRKRARTEVFRRLFTGRKIP